MMSNGIRMHLRHNLVGYVAIFISLTTGTAWAAASIGSRQVIDNSLRSVDLQNNAAVRSADVVDDTVTGGGLQSSDIAADALTGADITALTGADVENDSLTNTDITNLRGTDIVDNSLTGTDISESSLGIVPNADKLDGLDSSAFVGKCKTGSIRGFVRVNGNLDIGSSFSTTGTSLAYNCAGSAPVVRRINTGRYELCFRDNLATAGIGNPVVMGDGDPFLDNILTWERVIDSTCSSIIFRITVFGTFLDGYQARRGHKDAPFFFAVL